MKKLILLLTITTTIFAQEGSITGFIYDKETESLLIGVNVIVEGTNYGAASDITGEYLIQNLPARTYNISFEMIGYGKLKKLNIPLNPDKSQRLDVKLASQSLLGNEVVVTGNTFS